MYLEEMPKLLLNKTFYSTHNLHLSRTQCSPNCKFSQSSMHTSLLKHLCNNINNSSMHIFRGKKTKNHQKRNQQQQQQQQQQHSCSLVVDFKLKSCTTIFVVATKLFIFALVSKRSLLSRVLFLAMHLTPRKWYARVYKTVFEVYCSISEQLS